MTQSSSKPVMYRRLNPDLRVHDAYTTTDYVNERERIIFTRFRLCSHHLKVETKRWARIDADKRVCDCGGDVQDEPPVLFDCPKTEDIRQLFGVNYETYQDVGSLMNEMSVHQLISFVSKCMKHFT